MILDNGKFTTVALQLGLANRPGRVRREAVNNMRRTCRDLRLLVSTERRRKGCRRLEQ